MTQRSALIAAIAAGVLAVAVPSYADSPGQSASAPGQSGTTPGQSATATGLEGTTPGQSGTTPGPSSTTPPGQSATTPGQSGSTTGQSGTAPGQSGEPTPVRGESVVAGTPAGTVHVRTPDGKEIEVDSSTEIPVGSVIDATSGTIVLTAARPDGTADTGSFTGGVFMIRQDPRSGYTDLYLRGGSFARCGTTTRHPASASSAKGTRILALASASRSKSQPVRRLWGSDDGGRFRTHGRNSVTTVRGTKWLTEDRCSGTLTRVKAGAVDVRDNHTRRVVTVRAGSSYLARAR